MDDIEVRQLYHTAWKHWGAEAQVDMLIEEMAELTQALLHTRRNGLVFSSAVYEEMADVSICLDQMVKEIESIGKEDAYLDYIDKKLLRLKIRVEKSIVMRTPLKDITLGTPGSNR